MCVCVLREREREQVVIDHRFNQFKMEGLEAWEYDPSQQDPRLDHKCTPNRAVLSKRLEELGVLRWKLDVENWPECDPALEEIKSKRGYKYWETAVVAPGQMENYEEKIKQFYQEHLHPYDESRLILEGSGYWDIRNENEEWIRFRVEKGDMVVLPPGMYHRFTLDTNNYIKALLLYTECPMRIDVMRPDGDTLQARKDYVNNTFLKY